MIGLGSDKNRQKRSSDRIISTCKLKGSDSAEQISEHFYMTTFSALHLIGSTLPILGQLGTLHRHAHKPQIDSGVTPTGFECRGKD